jgi:quercetin dioxygenase-like cupin family protein
VGDFEPTAYKTSDFEACYKIHSKGEIWDYHYHKKGTEINLLIRGKMKIQDKILKSGDIFIIPPYEIADPEFLEECEIVILKTPSKTQDKYVINFKK